MHGSANDSRSLNHGSAQSYKALVIGSEGNIGAPLSAHLRSIGCEVLGFDLRPGGTGIT